MRVLMVTSECAPFAKTGGLADVVGALPGALAPLGVDAAVMMPAYPVLYPLLPEGEVVARMNDLPGGKGRIVRVTSQGLTLLLLDMPQLFDRPGGLYGDENGQDWPDNHLRFGALAQAAARVARGGKGGVKGYRADVVHAHDWQAGLVPAYLAMHDSAPPSIITIHNLAFQGRFNRDVMGPLGLPKDWFTSERLEYHGDVSFLKAGLVMADRITTVSPTYAREILTPEFGMGFDGVLQARAGDLVGLLNGIDLDVWNPADDPALPQGYSDRALSRKARSRAALAKKMGLEKSDGPLFCVVSRMSEQKGFDALLAAVPHIVGRGAQLAVLGSGAPELERGFRDAARDHPGRVGVHIGYDEPLSHLMQGGSDAIVIPSRFEPCGLTQLYGLRYGTLPVVARTGGLADTVIDANPVAMDSGVATGFVFHDVSGQGIAHAVDRVCEIFPDRKAWQQMQRNAMRQDVGWERSAKGYAELYAAVAG